MNELFYKSNDEDRIKGYLKEDGFYNCLLCDYKTEVGMIYPVGDLYADAEKKMRGHIEEEHGSVFDHLISFDKKINGFSDHQSKLMKLFYAGLTDYEVQTELNIGSASTIRNHRHMLKEKEKQAKMMVTIMSLLNEQMSSKLAVKPHKTATMIDKRYDTTLEETMDVLDKYFPDGLDGPLKTFRMKEKYKLVVLREIVKRFEHHKMYTSTEVDVILKAVYLEDYVQVRRYLIEYGFMDRTRDGRTYWVKEKQVTMEKKTKKTMKKASKKAKVQAYLAELQDKKTESGVFEIVNTENQKKYIGSARNISQLNGVTFQLNTGSFRNKGLQKEWNEFGQSAYKINILEAFEEKEDMQVVKALKVLEKKWKEKLQPFGDKGYHKG